MLYLLDANVLIDANRDYYSIDRIAEFWEWLIYVGGQDQVKIPLEIYEELKSGNDNLAAWAKSHEAELALLLGEEVEVNLVSTVIDDGYANDLTDDEVEKLGRDPFLIAYALKYKPDRCVVTTEVSKPKKQRANKHVPNVCESFGIPWCHTFEFVRSLNFSTRWKEHI